MMGTRGGDILATRKPHVMARHPPNHAPPPQDNHHNQGVDDGRGGRGSGGPPSKVSKIAGIFQSSTGGGATTVGLVTRPSADDTQDGPGQATVVRTESHLARFNNARALFEKIGGSTDTHTPPQQQQQQHQQQQPQRPTVRTANVKLRHGLSAGSHGGSNKIISDRAGSVSPARSLGASSSSSRSPSPSPARASTITTTTTTTTPGHIGTSNNTTNGHHATTGNGHANHHNLEVSTAVVSLRRPGSASSRSHSASSTESEPTPGRPVWPPNTVQNKSDNKVEYKPDTKVDTSEVVRRIKPDKPVKPDLLNSDKNTAIERPASTHEQHLELVTRQKNWFANFSKSRTPISSPVKCDLRPTSPGRPVDLRPISPSRQEIKPASPFRSDIRPLSPSRPELKKPVSPSKTDLRSPRGVTREDTEDVDKRRERLYSSKSEDCLSREDKPSDSGENGAAQWSSVLQNRYGRSLKDTTKISRSEDEVFRFDHYSTNSEENSTNDWDFATETESTYVQSSSLKDLSSNSVIESSESRIFSEVVTSESKSVPEASTSGNQLASGLSTGARSSISETESNVEEDDDDISAAGVRHESENQTKSNNATADWRKERAAILGRSGLRHSQSEDEAPTKVQHRFEDVATLQSHWSPPTQYNQSQAAKTIKDESNVAETKRTQTYNKISNSAEQLCSESEVVECKESLVSLVEKKEHADLIVSESVVLKDSAKEKDIERKHESLTKSSESISQRYVSSSSVSQSESVRESQREESSVVTSREELRLRKSKETTEEVNHRLKESISCQSVVPHSVAEKRTFFRREEAREERSEDSSTSSVTTSSVNTVICKTDEQKHTDVRLQSLNESEDSSEINNASLEEDKDIDISSNKSEDGSAAPSEGGSVVTSEGGSSVVVESLVVDTLSALKAETVYMSSSEDVSVHDDSRRDQSSISEDTVGASPNRQKSISEEVVEEMCMEKKNIRQQEEAPRYIEEQTLNDLKPVIKDEEQHSGELQQREDLQDIEEDPACVRRRLFPDLIEESEAKEIDTRIDSTKDSVQQSSQTESLAALDALIHRRPQSQSSSNAGSQPVTPRSNDQQSQPQPESQTLPAQVPEEKSVESQVTLQSPLIHTQISADFVTSPHIQLEETSLCEESQTHVVQYKRDSQLLTEDEEIVYDHTVKSAQHKIQFCTTPVTVEGVLPTDDAEPEPLPPPIPPHGLEPGRLPPSYESITKGNREKLVSSTTEAETNVNNIAPTTPPAPEPMTHDEAQRLLSANIVHQKRGGLLSDAEAHEVALLLSPGAQDTVTTSLHNSAPPPVPPHYADVGPPVVPPHYGPVEDEYDSREASHFDPTLASPLSPEDAPSTPDSEISGDVLHVARVKEVLMEDGIHYLEDGHFWVEVPGLPEHDEDDEFEPDLPYHAHTKLSFSKHPMQMFSTYSVSEYDRKNEDVDPVAASAEYELEKRVEKMDIFPVDILKGDGGLGLSIIGMGVGADAGVEKLGIFVKTITPQGATEKDDRIQVNDQIIEVDGKSLVGVTQVFAASVLKNTSGRVHFLIGREKDPENSEVALLIKQSLQADHEREERRRALGGPEYDPRIGAGLFDPLSSPSEENSRSEEASSVAHNYASYMDAGGSSPTSPDAMSPPPDVFDQGDTDDTSPDNDTAVLRLKLKEGQYKNAIAEAEITKLKMKLVEVESHLLDQRENTTELVDLRAKVRDAEERLHAKLAEASTYQDMLEQSQGQFIVLEKKYYKAKKIIKEYQGRERDFLHREEYHITQLEDKDSHYNALVKALKDRVISLEADLMEVQKVAGLPVGPPKDTTSAYQLLHQHQNQHQQPKPPAAPPQDLETEISDTENSDSINADDEKANTVERKVQVCEELDEAVPPHELLDVSATRAKGELGMRGGLAGRHLPSLKKATSISSTSSQEQSIDEGPSIEDDLPEALKSSALEASIHEGQEQADLSHIPSPAMESPASPNQPPWMPTQPPPPYSQATHVIQATTPTGAPPPYHHPPPQQFATPILPPSHRTSDSPTTSLPSWQPHMGQGSEYFDPQRPEIPGYRHPPPVARVQPVNRAEISESLSMVQQQQQQQHHLTAGRTPLQQSLAEQLKQLLAERESEGISQTPVSGASDQSVRLPRDASPSKPLPNSLIEDVRQAVMQADVSSTSLLGRKPIISGPVHLSSAANVVPTGQMVAQATSPPQRQSANTSAIYSPGRDSTTSSSSPRLGRSMVHGNSNVSANPAGVVLLNQRPIDHQQQKMGSGVDVGSGGELSSGPGSLGSGDEGSGASLGSQSSLCYPQPSTERSKKSHMWQTAAVTDWTKEQVCQWLVVQGLEGCVGKFQSGGITGPRLLNLDARDLKNLNLTSEEKNKIKRKVKELRLAVEKERKQVEKEKKEREKLMKKAEKLAKEAEKKKK